MHTHEPALPKHDLEAAIRRLIISHPHWFRRTVYVAAHKTHLNQWLLQIYQPTARYKPDQIYEQQDDPPRYWWWMVRHDEMDGSNDIHLLLENVTISPIFVAILHLGDAILEPDHTTLNIYERDDLP